jgi:hypothetical protein
VRPGSSPSVMPREHRMLQLRSELDRSSGWRLRSLGAIARIWYGKSHRRLSPGSGDATCSRLSLRRSKRWKMLGGHLEESQLLPCLRLPTA